MSHAPKPSTRSSRGRGVYVVVGVLLLIPIVLPLLVNTYARTEPQLFGFPFFFWYQFMWIPIAAALTYACYILVTRQRKRDRNEGGRR